MLSRVHDILRGVVWNGLSRCFERFARSGIQQKVIRHGQTVQSDGLPVPHNPAQDVMHAKMTSFAKANG